MNKYKVHLKSGNVIEVEHEDLPGHILGKQQEKSRETRGMMKIAGLTVNGTYFTLDQIAAIELVRDES